MAFVVEDQVVERLREIADALVEEGDKTRVVYAMAAELLDLIDELTEED